MEKIMKRVLILASIFFCVGTIADNSGVTLDPVASAPQVVVVYRNTCPGSEEKAISMIKDLIAYERKASPIAYSSVPGVWNDGTIGAIDLHQSVAMMEKAFEWQGADSSWSAQYNAIVEVCGGNEFDPAYMVTR